MYDLFDIINQTFSEMDGRFRSIEKNYGVPSLLPLITTPSIKNKLDRRVSVVSRDGVTRYFLDGMLHNDNGPAVVYDDDKKENEYWLEGVRVSEQEVEAHKEKLEEEKIHTLYVDHTPIKVTGKKLKEIKDLLSEEKERV